MQVEKTGSFVEVQISENRWNTGCNALVPLEHHYTYFIQRGPCSRPDGNATARRGLDPAPAAGPADCFSSRTPAADSSGHDGSIPGHAAVPGNHLGSSVVLVSRLSCPGYQAHHKSSVIGRQNQI
ncbi:unnamed protein product [Nezara viridula]|uniref:Uncharacterized protein n=1 Tax=Nezara viridula TaxID=85310 RepID=A0A9P0E5U4_NEZVI|nr:unnamed protein product [Nezara viridula]